MVDQIRFFAGAARHLEGKAAGEYMANMTSFIRREPVGVCAQVAPWNYPMMMARLEVRSGDRRRQHGGAQAERHHAGHHDAARRDLRRVPAAWRAERHLRRPRPPAMRWSSTTRRRWCRSPARCARAWKSPPLRRSRSSGSISNSAARRRSIVFDDADIAAAAEGIAIAGLLQRRPGLHRCHPRAGRARRIPGLRRGARRAGSRTRGRNARPATTSCSDRSTTRISSRTSAGSSIGLPIMPTSSPADTASATAGSSSSPPSCRTCARTTR